MAKNDIKIGSSELSNIAIGNNDVDKVYLGKDLVWERYKGYNFTVNLSRELKNGETLAIQGDLACSFSEGEKTKSARLNEDKDTFTLGLSGSYSINDCQLINIINDGIVEPYNFRYGDVKELRLYNKDIKHSIDVMFYNYSNITIGVNRPSTKDFSKNDFIVSINGTKFHIVPTTTHFTYFDWYKGKDTIMDVELIEVSNRQNLETLSIGAIDLLKTPKLSININYALFEGRLCFWVT